MYIFGLPLLFYWVLVYPLSCLFYMIYSRNNIENINFRIRMGYYLNGYKKEHYYW